jgi:hypothetical protein
MSINKNFVVRHGFEVSTDLILADADTRSVGVGTTSPQYTLEVVGGIGAEDIFISGVGTFSTLDGDDIYLNNAYINSGIITSLTSNDGIIDFLSGTNLNYTGISSFGDIKGVNQEIIGIATFNSLQIDGNLSVGGTIGQQNQILISTGIGVTWKSIDNIRTTTTFAATNGQTEFPVSYSIGYVDVYINGVKLSNVEFIALDGNTVILNDPCFGNEVIEIISYNTNFPLSFAGITIQKEGFIVGTEISAINFVGASVTAVSAGSGVTVFVDNYWTEDSSNIYALSNVGIGTTNPTSALTVEGDGSFSGIVTATGGFISVGNTTPIQISLDGNQLTFIAVGIGSTTLTLF